MDKKLFDKLIRDLRQKTCLLSKIDIEYQQEYSGPYEDLSYYGDDCIVIAAIKDGKITGFGRPVIAIGTDKGLKVQFKRLYNISPDILYLDFLSEGRLSGASKFLLKRGLSGRPYYTQIVDLTKTEKELHGRFEKKL